MDVGAWLEDHGLGQYAEDFASNDIDVALLRTLTADDLKELGVTSLGHRKKLLAAIAELVADAAPRPRRPPRRPRSTRRAIWPSACCARARRSRASASRSRCCSPTSRARSR